MWDYIIPFIASAITGIAGWVVGKKRQNADTDSVIISNLRESLSFYEEIAQNNKEKLDEIIEENKLLRSENAELREKIDILEEQVRKLTEHLLTNDER